MLLIPQNNVSPRKCRIYIPSLRVFLYIVIRCKLLPERCYTQRFYPTQTTYTGWCPARTTGCVSPVFKRELAHELCTLPFLEDLYTSLPKITPIKNVYTGIPATYAHFIMYSRGLRWVNIYAGILHKALPSTWAHY